MKFLKINALSNINVSINHVQMPCIYILNLKLKCCLKQDFKTIKSRHKNLHPLSYFGSFSLDFLWFTLSFFPFREKKKRKKKFPQLCNFGLLELQGFANMLCLRNFSYCFKMCLCFFFFFLNLHPKKPKVTGRVIQGGFLHPVKHQATKSLHQHLS